MIKKVEIKFPDMYGIFGDWLQDTMDRDLDSNDFTSDDYTNEELVKFAEEIFTEGAPGVDGIAAKAHEAKWIEGENEGFDDLILSCVVTLDVRDYLGQCVAYGIGQDQYLPEIAKWLTKDEFKELLGWAKDQEFDVAMIGPGGVDKYPYQFKID